VYQLSNMFPADPLPGLGVSKKILPIFVIPGCLVILFLAMPIIGRIGVGHCFNQTATFLLLLGIAALTYVSYRHDAGSREYQFALADGRFLGQRAQELAQSPLGIPATGALALLRNDAKVQGAALFQQHCASCHSHTGGKGKDILCDTPSAPNLGGFAGAKWLSALLDPDHVSGPEYFGNTKFKDGSMPEFVRGTLKELRRDADLGGEESLKKIVACLEAESKLSAPRTVAGETIEGIDGETAILFEDFTCTDCHKFYNKGTAGNAPDLTGYGSRDWLVGIIRDPAHARFYGQKNDRMPAYYRSDKEYTLTLRQIEMIADWLHGVWYEPGLPRGK
jgi:ubiquinol-cytochrome c reductase cytochrome b subunit